MEPPARTDDALARLVTDVLAPTNLVMSVIVVTSVATSGLAGLGWAALAAVFAGGLPLAYLVAGVRRGRHESIHVRVREQRRAVVCFGLVSVLAGVVVLWACSAPRVLVVLVVAMLAGLAAVGVITLVWKISFHTATAAGVSVVLAVQFGPWALLCAVVVALIGWSRVRLGDHTLAQVCAGAVVGAAAAAAVFGALD
jgi:membrane-associated phospholipid phosphatase